MDARLVQQYRNLRRHTLGHLDHVRAARGARGRNVQAIRGSHITIVYEEVRLRAIRCLANYPEEITHSSRDMIPDICVTQLVAVPAIQGQHTIARY